MVAQNKLQLTFLALSTSSCSTQQEVYRVGSIGRLPLIKNTTCVPTLTLTIEIIQDLFFSYIYFYVNQRPVDSFPMTRCKREGTAHTHHHLLLAIVFLVSCNSLPADSFCLAGPTSRNAQRSNILVTITHLNAHSMGKSGSDSIPQSVTKERPGGVRSRISKAVLSTVSAHPLVTTGLALLAGYSMGVRATAMHGTAAATTGSRSVMNRARQWPLVTMLLVAFGVKEIWFATPLWLKRNLPWVGRKYRGDAKHTAPTSDDLTSLLELSAKMRALFAQASTKLHSDASVDDENGNNSLTIAFLVLLQLMGQIKEKYAHQRDDGYKKTGRAIDFTNEYQGLDETFEFADWAYDELPNEQTLEDALQETGFTLLRHDKPEKPGYVSHYVAISKERKTVLIGVKGTSGLEDMLTDCCGLAVSHDLPGPFVQSGATSIRCHEGILLSAQRLAANLEVLVEELLLPTGYKILITGHSLGAGVAALLGVLLRARFPTLLTDTGTMLRVMAFASPPVLDCDSALACDPFCTTVVNNSDIIPRASLSNLIVLIEFLKILDEKLEAMGKKPTDLVGVSQLLLSLAKKDNDPVISVDEVMASWDQAFDKVELRDPDHLYVPGKVIQMYDLWAKQDCGNVDEAMNQELDEVVAMDDRDDETAPEAMPLKGVRTAERAQITDGTSKVLRSIELDSRLLSDHLAPTYRSSIRSLLGT